jgi:hypothetical protein
MITKILVARLRNAVVSSFFATELEDYMHSVFSQTDFFNLVKLLFPKFLCTKQIYYFHVRVECEVKRFEG